MRSAFFSFLHSFLLVAVVTFVFSLRAFCPLLAAGLFCDALVLPDAFLQAMAAFPESAKKINQDIADNKWFS
jgi:hypothetical protein